ncbi:MAG: APC family permease [Solirubrobacteraceae bacterium]
MSSVSDVGPGGAGGSGPEETHLATDALGRLDAIVMAVAGSAPAYTIAATTATVIGAVALAGPAAILWCGIPMLGIAIAYHQLNKMGANAGAAYSWVGRVIHPGLGFLTGWALVVAATIFMVAGSLPAGQVTLSLFSSTLPNHVWLVTVVGAVWFLVMAYFVARGVRITANAQWIMSSIEVLLLAVFAVIGILHGHHAVSFSMSWFGFSHFHSYSAFIAGALIATFYYWGWDVSSNLSEETANSEKHSGMGAIIGVFLIFVLFEAFTVAINMDLTPKQIASGSSNVLQTFGQMVGNSVGAKLMIIAVMLSTIATLETTLIQVSRSLFSMSREQTLPARFGRLHPQWQTPVFATGVVVVISLALFVASNLVGGGINQVMTDAIDALGLQIAIYYSLAGFAAVIGFRKLLFDSISNFFFMGLFPLLGAIFMLWVFVESIVTPGNLTTTQLAIGLGALAIGLVPAIYYYFKGSPYLHEVPTLGRVNITKELPLEGTL